nr:DDE-type integrase/transposase/recombinase [Vaginella massiliensis]
MPRIIHQSKHLLFVEAQIWWHGSRNVASIQGIGVRKCSLEKDVSGFEFGSQNSKRGHRKKALGLCQKRDLAEELTDDKQFSTARACRIIGLERSGYYYQSIKDDTEVERRLLYYAEKLLSRGCPEYTKRIRKEGYGWNHKRIERIYRKLGLNKRRRKVKCRIPNPGKEYLLQPIAPNITWSMEFMSDVLENGRKIRILNVIDDYNREALMCEIDYSFASEKVVKLVQRLIEWYGKPTNIRTDNGTEFIAKAFEGFCSNSSIWHIKIQKGTPCRTDFVNASINILEKMC